MCGLPTQICVASPHKFFPSLYKYGKIEKKMPGYSCLNYTHHTKYPSNRLQTTERSHFTPHFHMCTISSVLSTVRKGDYSFKIDLQDESFHVPIHPDSRKYLRFAFENKVYQFQVLPFSLNTAPQLYGRISFCVTWVKLAIF